MSTVDLDDHPSVRRVRAALDLAGVSAEVVVLQDHARTAALAAEQLGVSIAQIANSLLFAVPMTEPQRDHPLEQIARPLLVLTSGAHRVDPARVATLIGAPRLDRADADFVRASTGFAIGGVAPVGHLQAIQTLLDEDLGAHDEIWAAAGHPRTVFRTTFTELLRMTGGTVARVA